jgi:outer membrane protein insertion porin family
MSFRRASKVVAYFGALLIGLALPALPVFSAVGQSAAKAGTAHLDSVNVTGSKKFSSGEIASAVGLRAGTSINRDDLQAAADKLAALGLFSNVQFHFTTVESGVRATYEVADAPAIPVSFDNFPWFTDDELTAALKRTVLLFDGSAPQRGTILDAMSGTLEKLVQTRSVVGNVAHTLVNLPLGGQCMQFRVEGADLTVKSIEFSDALATSDHKIQQSASDLVGKPYSRGAVELFEFEQVRPVYLAHAFLHVQFGPPSARVTSDGQPASGGVVVVAPIAPGPAYKWGGGLWKGNSVIPTRELNAMVDLKLGDVADGNKIAALWERIQSLYGERGYLDAKVDPQPQFYDQDARVIYDVTIVEGPQYRMGSLILTGLSIDGEKRVRAGWSIPADAIFNEKTYEDFLEAGIKRAFAGTPVHYDKVGRFLQENPGTGKVDVLLDFQ